MLEFVSPDFRAVFRQAEVTAALAFLTPNQEEAARIAAQLYAEAGEPWVPAGDLLSALSLVSDDAAARVRTLLGETRAEEAKRLAAFREFLKQRRDSSDENELR